MNKYDSILLIGFGGPERPEDVKPFIENVLRGRPVPPGRIEEVANNYKQIGGSSPYNKHIFDLANKLDLKLKEQSIELPIYIGMRVWSPYLVDTLERMGKEGKENAIGIVLAPHQSEPSWNRYLDAVEAARQEIVAKDKQTVPTITYLETWFDHPLFIHAIAERVSDAFNKIPENERYSTELVFTAHSIPVQLASTYTTQLSLTAEAVAKDLNINNWTIAYQSRSGNPRDPWLEPDIRDLIRDRAKEGRKNLVVAPIGFICDHTEVLFDLDIDAKGIAEAAGINMVRAGTVGTHPSFVRMFAEIILNL
jgi:protoporphyrin/coproporphyrin ferrochelatase